MTRAMMRDDPELFDDGWYDPAADPYGLYRPDMSLARLNTLGPPGPLEEVAAVCLVLPSSDQRPACTDETATLHDAVRRFATCLHLLALPWTARVAGARFAQGVVVFGEAAWTLRAFHGVHRVIHRAQQAHHRAQVVPICWRTIAPRDIIANGVADYTDAILRWTSPDGREVEVHADQSNWEAVNLSTARGALCALASLRHRRQPTLRRVGIWRLDTTPQTFQHTRLPTPASLEYTPAQLRRYLARLHNAQNNLCG